MKINIERPPKEILQKIEEVLLRPNFDIENIYEQLFAYYLKANDLNYQREEIVKSIKKDLITKNDLADTLNLIKEKNIRTISIDFPLMLKSTQNKKETIVVVAMDPLAPNVFQTSKETENIGYWVPFSLIDSEKTGQSTFRTNRTFFLSLLKNYNVYITDIYKLFYRLGDFPEDKKSNADKTYLKLESVVHVPILEKEFEILNPKVIVTLGNKSRNAIYKIQNAPIQKWDDVQIIHWSNKATKQTIPVISIPHISGSANGASIQLLEKYPDLVGDKMEKLAQLIKLKIETLVK